MSTLKLYVLVAGLLLLAGCAWWFVADQRSIARDRERMEQVQAEHQATLKSIEIGDKAHDAEVLAADEMRRIDNDTAEQLRSTHDNYEIGGWDDE